MKAYRYEAKERTDRAYNKCGKEKNPNNISFYAKSLQYAEKYQYVYFDDGDVNYECELVISDVDGNFFNMNESFRTLLTFRSFVDNKINEQRKDYEKFLSNAKTKKSQKIWKESIAHLSNRENELVSALIRSEFQELSDFDLQNKLVAELKTLGFDGYETINEIAIF